MLKQVMEIVELVDRPRVTREDILDLFSAHGMESVEVLPVQSETGTTQVVKIEIAGIDGKSAGGRAPTLGILGYLGGVGARPHLTGLVSDGDGAVAALSVAVKLSDMARLGDRLRGDILVATHVCTDAPVIPHEPVPFMGSPIGVAAMNEHVVDPRMEGILSIDTTKGNRVINHRGFALSPTIKEGYVLRVDEELLSLQQYVTGKTPSVFAVATQDITPYGNDLYHLNSILQPATATKAPVVGVAITAEVPVPGCATGASQEIDIEQAARFVVEAAKSFTEGKTRFYDPDEFEQIVSLYGSMTHLQTLGRRDS